MGSIDGKHSVPADEQRGFALSVVQKLRSAGFQSLWAGGCVRDALLGIEPSDYDVATDAPPEEVIRLFGKRRTVPVGASFGVVMVLDPAHRASPVEVATFRSDGQYVDGRRPVSVQFSSPEEDAQRRDFTINGMFFDPIEEQVIDYVGGHEDLQQRIVRAIGDAQARLSEDKLRMLRAIRFASTYDFSLDGATFKAIQNLREQICQVSIERIAQELRRMFAHSSRPRSLMQLSATGLLTVLFPFVSTDDDLRFVSDLEEKFAVLHLNRHETAFALLFDHLYVNDGENLRHRLKDVAAECRKMRFSNDETDTIGWLIEKSSVCRRGDSLPPHILKPMLADQRHPLLIDLLRSQESAEPAERQACMLLVDSLKKWTAEELSPQPLIDGETLKHLGISPGPQFSQVLAAIRREQLDELIATPSEATARVKELLANSTG